MSAGELAGIVEGWATLAGLIVVALGAAFAGQQLRRESQARRLQALVALYADIWPIGATPTALIVAKLPDDFAYDQLSADERQAVVETLFRYNRLGYLLRAGLVRDQDLFPFPLFGGASVFLWEKVKHMVRTGAAASGEGRLVTLPGVGLHFEFLASRAQAYLLEHGEAEIGSIAVFDADLEAMAAMAERAQQARGAAG